MPIHHHARAERGARFAGITPRGYKSLRVPSAGRLLAAAGSRPQTRTCAGSDDSRDAIRPRASSSRARMASVSALACDQTWVRQALVIAVEADTGGGSIARI